MFKGEVRGFREIYRALDAIPAAASEKAMKQALLETGEENLAAAARVYAEKTRSEESRRGYGHLADNIHAFPRPTEGAMVRVAVGYPRKFFWGGWVEWGTEKMGRSPYLRPAWDAWKNQLLAIYAAKLWKRIRPAIARAARRAGSK